MKNSITLVVVYHPDFISSPLKLTCCYSQLCNKFQVNVCFFSRTPVNSSGQCMMGLPSSSEWTQTFLRFLNMCFIFRGRMASFPDFVKHCTCFSPSLGASLSLPNLHNHLKFSSYRRWKFEPYDLAMSVLISLNTRQVILKTSGGRKTGYSGFLVEFISLVVLSFDCYISWKGARMPVVESGLCLYNFSYSPTHLLHFFHIT